MYLILILRFSKLVTVLIGYESETETYLFKNRYISVSDDMPLDRCGSPDRDIYDPETLCFQNIGLILWHTQLNVCAVK